MEEMLYNTDNIELMGIIIGGMLLLSVIFVYFCRKSKRHTIPWMFGYACLSEIFIGVSGLGSTYYTEQWNHTVSIGMFYVLPIGVTLFAMINILYLVFKKDAKICPMCDHKMSEHSVMGCSHTTMDFLGHDHCPCTYEEKRP